MLVPGIETDSLIARKVWKVFVVNDIEGGQSYMVGQENHEKVPLPPFSTKTEEAYRVIEFFQNSGWFFRVKSVPEENKFLATFFKEDGHTYRFFVGATMPLAICAAALGVIDGTNRIG